MVPMGCSYLARPCFASAGPHACRDLSPSRSIPELCTARIVPACIAFTFVIGLLGLAGWILRIEALKGVGFSGIGMKANTAICLVLLATAIGCLRRPEAPALKSATGRILAAAVGTVGFLTFVQHVTTLDFGIDQFFFSEPPGEPATVSPGRMGPPTSLTFTLAGLGLYFVDRRRGWWPQAAGVLMGSVVSIPIVGYAYGLAPLHGIARYTGIALHSALALVAASIALIALRPAGGFMSVLCSDYAGGMMARRLIFPALLLPFTMGWIRTVGEAMGWIDPAVGRPIMIVLLTLTMVSLIWYNARGMVFLEQQRLSVERDRAEELARAAQALQQAKAAADASREQAEQASRAKTDFIAALSHELRTPLSPVLLTLSNLEHHPRLPAELRDDLQLVRKNLLLEVKLISDLLDLTRIEKQKLVLDTTEVDLHQVIRDTVHLCEQEDTATVTLELHAVHPWVSGDDMRLRQVFWNLLNNAQKFTPADGRIVITTDAPNAGFVRVRVSDNGAGISPALIGRLFTAFEQGPSPEGRRRTGLGLGLSITRNLVEAHRGTIAVASAGEGHGSTFTVELPNVARPGVAVTPPQPAAAVSSGKLRILLVEDHPATLVVLKKILGSLGHSVTTASSVAEASALAHRGGYDVLLSDLGLPDGTGMDLMRALGPRFHGRAIALSGYGTQADVQASREAGFCVHLTKPVEIAAITGALKTVSESASSATTSPLNR